MKIMKSIKFFATVIATAMFTVNAYAASSNLENRKSVKAECTSAKAEMAQSNSAASLTTIGSDKKVRFDYLLDNKGRVTTRIQKVWSDSNDDWVPVSAYMINYTDSETVVTYAKYNRAKGTFNYQAEQLRLNSHDYPYVFKVPSK